MRTKIRTLDSKMLVLDGGLIVIDVKEGLDGVWNVAIHDNSGNSESNVRLEIPVEGGTHSIHFDSVVAMLKDKLKCERM